MWSYRITPIKQVYLWWNNCVQWLNGSGRLILFEIDAFISTILVGDEEDTHPLLISTRHTFLEWPKCTRRATLPSLQRLPPAATFTFFSFFLVLFQIPVACFKTVLERFWRSEGVKTVKFYVAPWITTHKQTKKQKNKQTNKQVLLTLHFILFFKSKSPKITTCMFAFFFVTLPFTFVTYNRSLISPSSPFAIVSALTWLLSHNAYHQKQQSNTYFLHSSFHSYQKYLQTVGRHSVGI